MDTHNETTNYRAKAEELAGRMTLQEKVSLLSGNSLWTTTPVERLDVPSIFMTDGPHGLRKSPPTSIAESVPATCFPSASALGAAWDVELVKEVGRAIGRECQVNGVQILLGPGVNMKRSPLAGRNFEFYSEDPVLSGKLASAFIDGVQSEGVGACLKHLAANNQEYQRMTTSSNVDERTLREIYLRAFEIAVTESRPWTVMASYNKLNGVYTGESKWLLDEVLRKTWGYDGAVVSDWGAVDDRVAGVAAGLNLEMPGNNGANNSKIIQALENGELDSERVNELVTELLALILKADDCHKSGSTFDEISHDELAQRASAESIVLLKNSDDVLPINLLRAGQVAVIGDMARIPHYQGNGSSKVNPIRLSNALDALIEYAGDSASIVHAPGYRLDGSADEALIAEACGIAKNSNVAVVLAGLPDDYESEGFDRPNIDLPEAYNRLIEAVAAIQPNTIVVLMTGSAVSMPWLSSVKAVVQAWLSGQAGGAAIADVLTGRVNPSGKLSETVPERIEDTPAYPYFPGVNGEAIYGEGLFVGYRHYDKKKVRPLFPFGYGLSYTSFSYLNIESDRSDLNDTDALTVRVTLKNTGQHSGKEVVQLYVGDGTGKVLRPEKELKHFAKVDLLPGEEKTVAFELGFHDFAYFNDETKNWQTESGPYHIYAGGSSDALPLSLTVNVNSTSRRVVDLSPESTLRQLSIHPGAKMIYGPIIGALVAAFQSHNGNGKATSVDEKELARKELEVMLGDVPLKRLVRFSEGKFTDAMLNGLLKMVNSSSLR